MWRDLRTTPSLHYIHPKSIFSELYFYPSSECPVTHTKIFHLYGKSSKSFINGLIKMKKRTKSIFLNGFVNLLYTHEYTKCYLILPTSAHSFRPNSLSHIFWRCIFPVLSDFDIFMSESHYNRHSQHLLQQRLGINCITFAFSCLLSIFFFYVIQLLCSYCVWCNKRQIYMEGKKLFYLFTMF